MVEVFEVVGFVAVVVEKSTGTMVVETGVLVVLVVVAVRGTAAEVRRVVFKGLNFSPGAAAEGFCFGGRVFYVLFQAFHTIEWGQ